MEVFTTQPGVQFNTGNFLDGKFTGKGSKVYNHRGAFCLETQHFPDSPNHPAFPTTELKPGQTLEYFHRSISSPPPNRMDATADIVVIGSGIVGASVAWHLGRRMAAPAASSSLSARLIPAKGPPGKVWAEYAPSSHLT